MADFDPELYLRLIGEREIAPGVDMRHRRLNGRAHLPAAAGALAVAGVLDGQLAQSIVDDYAAAAALAGTPDQRRHQAQVRMHAPSAPPHPEPLAPRSVYTLATTLTVPGGELDARTLIVGKDTSELSAVLRWNPPRHRAAHNGPVTLNITVPGGAQFPAHFSGGWNEHAADGNFSITGLPPDAEWIEVEGRRIALPDPVAPPEFVIDRVSPERVLIQYLWQLLGDFSQRRAGLTAGPAADSAAALIAAGLIAPEDPELEAVRWAADAVPDLRHARIARAAQPTRIPPPAIAHLVPEQWRALLSGSRVSGSSPEGSIAIGAVSPVFDGLSVAVDALDSGPDGFTLRIEATGLPHEHPYSTPVKRTPVSWWVADDRGHHYLGQLSGHRARDNWISGRLEFGRLDPRATVLTVTVATMAARARLTIPLDWEGSRSGTG